MSLEIGQKSQFASFIRWVKDFRDDRRGAIAYLTAILSVVMIGMTGLALDYGMSVVHKARLDAAAQAAVSSGVNAARNLLQLNMTQNSQFDAQALAEGERVALEAFDGQLGPTSQVEVGIKYVVLSRVGNTISAQFDYLATSRTVFSQAFGVTDFEVKGTASIIVGLLDNPPSSKLLEEVWSTPNAPLAARPITDPIYRDWQIQDGQVQIAPTRDSRAGEFAILVGDGTKNSVAKKVFMPAGFYEFRYWYKSAVVYPEYQPAHICNALIERNSEWAMSDKYREYTGSAIVSNSPQSARISVYLHPVRDDPRLNIAPPRSADFTNRLDTCIYAGRWIERSIKVEITHSGYFWLGFVADALPNSNKRGGWIGKVKLCIASCGEPEVNNFPYRNGDILMEDSFDSPIVTRNTVMGLARRVFTAQALYETPPSTAWEAPQPSGVFLSREGVLVQGQHLLVNKTQYMYRRMLLPPGRYAVRYLVRGDNRSYGCPQFATEREGGGISLCGNPFSTNWGQINYCVTTVSTHFIRAGFDFYMPGGVGEIRVDLYQIVAGYNGAEFGLRPSSPFCTYQIAVGLSGGNDQWGNTVRRLDRVIVTPPRWQ